MSNRQPNSRTHPSRTHGNPLALLAALLFAVLLLGVGNATSLAQQPNEDRAGQGGDRAAFAGMQRINGEVTGVSGNTLSMKTEDGPMQVVTTDNTRLMKGRGVSLKAADIKPGDGITAAGNLDAPNKTLHAAIVFVIDAAQLKQYKDNLGKTYIAGKVTAIDLDNAKLTVERPDHVSQTIGLDENTSFRRGGRVNMGAFGGGIGGPGGGGAREGGGAPPAATGGESITLADIKVGDNVAGQGVLRSGVFVPAVLNVATPGAGRRRGAAPNVEPAVPPAAAPPQR